MPEMPEVQGLVDFLRERIVGLQVARVSVAQIAALKTFDPPVHALQDTSVVSVARAASLWTSDAAGRTINPCT